MTDPLQQFVDRGRRAQAAVDRFTRNVLDKVSDREGSQTMTHTMDKAAVAAAIDRSEKHVERLVAEGKLTQVYGQLHGRGPRRALYDPAEVARIATAGRTAPPVALLAADQTPASNGNGRHPVVSHRPPIVGQAPALEPAAPSADQILGRLVELGRAMSATLSRMSETRPTYITMAAAAAELGLSEPKTRRLVKALKLETQRDREGLKVRRSALPR